MNFIKKVSDEIKRESLADIDEEDEKDKIETKEDKERRKKAEKYVMSSYNNFLFHYKNGSEAYKKDVKNCKKMDIHSDSRDFIWFFFLGIFSYDTPSNWKKILAEKRSNYDKLKKELITKDINDFVETKKIKDKYSLYFKFKEILSKEDYSTLDIIKIDVNRTFQTIDLFHLDKIQKILIINLFIFAKKNKDIGYRQGMSDLCAVFLYVLYKEQVLKPAFIVDKETFTYFLFHSNNSFLEHDTYLMFSTFMLKGFSEFFKYSDEIYSNGDLAKLDNDQCKVLTKDEIINANDSELKKRIFLIYYDKLPLVDKNLYKFMSDKTDPDIFMLKWFICLFTREFPINQLVHLWDLILLYELLNNENNNIKDANNEIKKKKKIDNKTTINNNNTNINNINIIKENGNSDNIKKEIINQEENKINFEKKYMFIDYIILSMILKIKNIILQKKNSSQLIGFLMKYPQDIYVEDICLKALDIFNKLNPNFK